MTLHLLSTRVTWRAEENSPRSLSLSGMRIIVPNGSEGTLLLQSQEAHLANVYPRLRPDLSKVSTFYHQNHLLSALSRMTIQAASLSEISEA